MGGKGKSQKVEIPGTDDGLGTALHPQLATEVIDVSLDRVYTQHESLCNLAVGGPFQQQAQHLALPLGQWFHKWIVVSRGVREI